MFLPAILAMITFTACSGDPPTRSDPIDPSPPSVQVIAPIQTDPGNPILIEWISDAETCSAPWTSQKSPSGRETVRISKGTWFPVECRKKGVIVRDSAYVSVLSPSPSRRIVVIVQYVASESTSYTPDTVTLTLKHNGEETRIRVLDTTSIEAPNSYGDMISFSIPGNDSYYPIVADVPRRNFSIENSPSDTISVVRIPRNWKIERGTYRGTVIKTTMIAGFDTAPDGSSFLRRSNSVSFRELGGYTYHPYGLDPKLFPIRVALDRVRYPNEILTPQDSIDLWKGIEKMEEKYGRDLFRPGQATYEVEAHEFHVSVNPSGATPLGGGRGSFENPWELIGGTFVSTNAANRFQNELLVEHELMHGFGFGHHCKWVSIMLSNCPRGDELVVYPSPEKDVAYFELRFAVNKVRRVHKALYHWGENLNGERLERGLPSEPIFYGNPFTKGPRP